MLTKRQNMIETMKVGGHPDRFVNGYEALGLVMGSPFGKRNPNPKPGELNVVNAWGITKSWPKGTPGAFPVHTPDKIVIKDIEEWQKYVKVPRVKYDAEEWEPFIEMYEKVDRNEQFACAYFAPGVFEQCHYLLEIQNCLMAFYEYPDEMHELIDMITQFELGMAARSPSWAASTAPPSTTRAGPRKRSPSRCATPANPAAPITSSPAPPRVCPSAPIPASTRRSPRKWTTCPGRCSNKRLVHCLPGAQTRPRYLFPTVCLPISRLAANTCQIG